MLCLPPSWCWRGRLLGVGPTPEEERAAEEKQGVLSGRIFGSLGRARFARTKGAYIEKQKGLFFLSGRIEVARASRPGDPGFVRASGCRIEKSQSGSFLFWPNLMKKETLNAWT